MDFLEIFDSARVPFYDGPFVYDVFSALSNVPEPILIRRLHGRSNIGLSSAEPQGSGP